MKLLGAILNLVKQGNYKLAADLIDFKKRQEQGRKDNNKRVMDQMKTEDRLLSILEQSKQDREQDLLRPEQHELTYPERMGTPGRRYTVEVQYPSFDDNGAAYFDDDCLSEALSVTEEELKSLKKEEESGYLKIESIKAKLPKAKE